MCLPDAACTLDFLHSISICVHRAKYVLLMTLDGIDFTFHSPTVDRTEPENLIHEFMTLTRLKIDCIRYNGAAEIAKSSHSKPSVTTIISRWRPTQHTLTFIARAEAAVRIVKEHM